MKRAGATITFLALGLIVTSVPGALGGVEDASETTVRTDGFLVEVELNLAGNAVRTPGVPVPVVTAVESGAVDAVATSPAGRALPADAREDAPWRRPVQASATIPLLPDGSVVVRTHAMGGAGLATGAGYAARALTFTGVTDAVPAAPEDGDAAGVATGDEAPVADSPRDATDTREGGDASPGGDDAPADAARARASDGATDIGNVNTATRAATESLLVSPARAAALAAAVGGPALIGWALYHRVRGNQHLQNVTRRRIFELIESEPGIGVQEIARRVDVSYSTVAYHLSRLTSAHMIVMSEDGNKLRYYKNGGAFNEDERRVLPLLKNREALRVLACIVDRPGTYRAAIAEEMGVTATTVNWHLRRLVKADIIREERVGRSAHLYADMAGLQRALEPLVPKLEENDQALAEAARSLLVPNRMADTSSGSVTA